MNLRSIPVTQRRPAMFALCVTADERDSTLKVLRASKRHAGPIERERIEVVVDLLERAVAVDNVAVRVAFAAEVEP